MPGSQPSRIACPAVMRTLHDRLAKVVLGPLLAHLGEVITEAELVEIGQRADAFIHPDRVIPWSLDYLGVIGCMEEKDALLEYFSQAVRKEELWRCLRKQFYWQGGSGSRAGVPRRSRGEPLLGKGPPPRLWVLSAGRPDKLLETGEFPPRPGWPAGFYSLPFESGLVVLSELPRERATIILRLLARGRTRLEALDDLVALPKTAFEWAAFPGMMRWMGDLIVSQAAQPKKEQWSIQESKEWLENYERRLLEKGRRAGLADALARLLEQKFGKLPDGRRAQLDSAESTELSTWQARILDARDLDEVFAPDASAD